jgi:hypothetical protein
MRLLLLVADNLHLLADNPLPGDSLKLKHSHNRHKAKVRLNQPMTKL